MLGGLGLGQSFFTAFLASLRPKPGQPLQVGPGKVLPHTALVLQLAWGRPNCAPVCGEGPVEGSRAPPAGRPAPQEVLAEATSALQSYGVQPSAALQASIAAHIAASFGCNLQTQAPVALPHPSLGAGGFPLLPARLAGPGVPTTRWLLAVAAGAGAMHCLQLWLVREGQEARGRGCRPGLLHSVHRQHSV